MKTIWRIGILVIMFFVIIGVEQIVYHSDKIKFKDSFNATSLPDGYHLAPTIENKFCRFLVRSVIDWGLGDYPNYLVILWFCSILN